MATKNAKARNRQVEDRYHDLGNLIERAKNPIVEFHRVVKNSPEEYKLFNSSGMFSKRLGIAWYRSRPQVYVYYSLSVMAKFIQNKPSEFLKLNQEILKFLAQEFPVLYVILFKSIAISDSTLRARELPGLDEYPHLKLAYHNIPNRYKGTLNEILLRYYRFSKTLSE